jgi:hypothetical protein
VQDSTILETGIHSTESAIVKVVSGYIKRLVFIREEAKLGMRQDFASLKAF